MFGVLPLFAAASLVSEDKIEDEQIMRELAPRWSAHAVTESEGRGANFATGDLDRRRGGFVAERVSEHERRAEDLSSLLSLLFCLLLFLPFTTRRDLFVCVFQSPECLKVSLLVGSSAGKSFLTDCELLGAWAICSRRTGKLYKARSRLYRSRI